MIIEYAEWRIQGRGPGARAPLILDQNEAQRAEIIFLSPPPPPPPLPTRATPMRTLDGWKLSRDNLLCMFITTKKKKMCEISRRHINVAMITYTHSQAALQALFCT